MTLFLFHHDFCAQPAPSAAVVLWQAVLALTVGASLVTGCIPLHTSTHIIPPPSPAVFREAGTGNSLREVLVIPRYGSSSGISTMIGEGPDAAAHEEWLADPFIYSDGAAFTLKQPKAMGVMFGPGCMWIGTARSLHEVYVIAPCYHGKWVPLESDKTVSSNLEPISPPDSKREIAELRSALLETRRWEKCAVKFDAGDTRLVASCLDQWLEDLNGNTHADSKQ